MTMMLSESQRHMLQTKGVVLGRMLMGLLFVFSGIGMLMGGPAESYAAGAVANLGIPLAGLIAWAVVAVKIGAGGALMLGKHVGCAAALLIAFTVAATLIAHMSFEDINLFKNLAIVGGLLYAAAFGAGKWS